MKTAIEAHGLLPKDLRSVGPGIGPGRVSTSVSSGAEGCGCPLCGRRSTRAHSRSSRTVSDLPWHGVSVQLEVRARRSFHDEALCERRLFCERLPEIAARSRKTGRLEEALLAIVLELGGRAGARLVAELGLLVGRDALLRKASSAPLPDVGKAMAGRGSICSGRGCWPSGKRKPPGESNGNGRDNWPGRRTEGRGTDVEPRLSIVTLGVDDLGRAVAFYRDGLGWPLSGASEEDIAFFKTGGVVLALYPREALAEDVGVDPAGGGFSGVTLAHNVAQKEWVDSTLAEAASAGASIVKEAQDVFWGGRSGYFADPDGHLWEVAWAPGFSFAEDGGLMLPD